MFCTHHCSHPCRPSDGKYCCHYIFTVPFDQIPIPLQLYHFYILPYVFSCTRAEKISKCYVSMWTPNCRVPLVYLVGQFEPTTSYLPVHRELLWNTIVLPQSLKFGFLNQRNTPAIVLWTKLFRNFHIVIPCLITNLNNSFVHSTEYPSKQKLVPSYYKLFRHNFWSSVYL